MDISKDTKEKLGIGLIVVVGLAVLGVWSMPSKPSSDPKPMTTSEAGKLRSDLQDLISALNEEARKPPGMVDIARVDKLAAEADAKNAQLAKLEGRDAPAPIDRASYKAGAAAPSKPAQNRCCPDGADPIGFNFTGVYLDDKCRKQPVVQAQITACTPVNIPEYESEVEVVMSAPMPGAQVKNGSAKLVLGSRVVELEPLYVLRGGSCTPLEGSVKRLPRACNNGGLVCRTGRATTALGCSGCMTDAKGCPVFEGSMAYVEASPKR